MTTIRFIVLVAAIGIGAGVAWSQPSATPTTQPVTTHPALTPAQEKEARELLKQLGSDDYATREKATEKLIALGEGVQPILKAKLQEKDADPEVVNRIETIIAKTTPAQEGTEVTDAATGITVSLQPEEKPIVWTIQAKRDGKIIWQSTRSLGAGPTLIIMDGQVLVLPRGYLLDLATGRMVRRIRVGVGLVPMAPAN
jgi:hypothetical protein